MINDKEKIQALQEENDNLKRVVRYMYLTLGFYSTQYNYSEESRAGSLSGKLGIMDDHGRGSRQSMTLARHYFSTEEILSWNGPHEEKMRGCWEEANAVS